MICAGLVTSVHGLSGSLKIKYYLSRNFDITKVPVFIKSVKYLVSSLVHNRGASAIIVLSGVLDNQKARDFLGLEIFVEKSSLPDLKGGEFFYRDLIGCDVFIEEEKYAVVLDVHNFGASDIIELQLLNSKKTMMLPFTEEHCTDVNVAERKININPQI